LSFKDLLLKFAGAWMLAGGVITLISPILLIYDRRVDAVIGIIATLLFIIFASFEFGAARIAWKREIGGWSGIIQALLTAFLARIVMLFTAADWYYMANAIIGVGELVIFISIYKQKELFMPPPEELEKTIKKLAGPSIRVASECPSCNSVVEPHWECCPYCGTELQKLCGKCGYELEEGMAICPNCGTPIESVDALKKTIAQIRESLEEDAPPETKASRCAKLAENLLKVGDNEGALEAYTMAASYTGFPRKKGFFLVKKARILINMGRINKALEILDQALDLDPGDFAGAAEIKSSILQDSGIERKGGLPRPS